MSAPQPTPFSPVSPTQFHAPVAGLSSPAPDTEPPGSAGGGSTVIGSSSIDHQIPIGLGLRNTALPKTDIELAIWGSPAGLHMRRPNDENLVIFQRAVGINSNSNRDRDSSSSNINTNTNTNGNNGNSDNRPATEHATSTTDAASLEAGQGHTAAPGLPEEEGCRPGSIYAAARAEIVIGASLTALGPSAGSYVVAITLLGAFNTVIAGLLALIKGQGLPDRLYHDRAEFKRVQDWIEQTEALLAVGVVGRDRKEVGLLVQTAFKKYNAAKHCEESNLPENYVRPPEPTQTGRPVSQGSQGPAGHPFPEFPSGADANRHAVGDALDLVLREPAAAPAIRQGRVDSTDGKGKVVTCALAGRSPVNPRAALGADDTLAPGAGAVGLEGVSRGGELEVDAGRNDCVATEEEAAALLAALGALAVVGLQIEYQEAMMAMAVDLFELWCLKRLERTMVKNSRELNRVSVAAGGR
ncbi:hypothetical protein F5144DRAFT_592914 [Chaetomium tenue]|uniref:Uncharacterized protein n=1 Tax=Chaetomium tenue TaxID=1854479 RepID=A0ACB7P7A0_9PEZI|nr:hypothetical protein F5144DRAFT_592914 [Chaetomium globosum]